MKKYSFHARRAPSPLLGGGILAVLFVTCASPPARGGVITVFSDNFQADTPGANPGAPIIGLPWQVTEPVSNGAIVLADPWTAGNQMLQFGPDYDTATAPLTTAAQVAVGSNGNATLNFAFHGSSLSNAWVSSFDAGLYAPDGSIATLIRIEPQTTGGTANIHSIYYLSPSSGLVNSGLTIAGDSWQNVSLTANLAGNSASSRSGATQKACPFILARACLPPRNSPAMRWAARPSWAAAPLKT